MKKSNISGKKSHSKLITRMIQKLETKEDLRIGEQKPLKSRVALLFRVLGANTSNIIIANVFALLFAIPVLVLLVYYLPNQIKVGTSGLYFMSSFGIGYGADPHAQQTALEFMYNQRIMVGLYLIPCIAFAGIGWAGLYFLARNMIWGVPIKVVKQFFRGIKKYWWKFLLGSTLLGLEVAFVIYAYSNNSLMRLTGADNFLSWFLVVLSTSLVVVTIPFLQIISHMFVAYKFKYGVAIKNTVILQLIAVIQQLIVNAILFLPLLMIQLRIVKYIILIFMLSVGVMYYVLASTLFANYTFDSFIRPLHDIRNGIVRKKKKTNKNDSSSNNEEKVVDVVAKEVKEKKRGDKKPKETEDPEALKRKERYKKAYHKKGGKKK